MTATDIYYKHSGKFNPGMWSAALALLVIAAVVVGAIYGAIVYYMPLVYVNGLLCVVFGVGMGFAVGKVAEWIHIRNNIVTVLTAVLVVLAAEYGAFVGWLFTVSQEYEQPLTIMQSLDPSILINKVTILASVGIWGLFGDEPVKGTLLYIIWLIEAAILLGGAVIIAYGVVVDEAYCENCKQWIKSGDSFGPFAYLANKDDVKNRLEQGDFSALEQMQAIDEANEPRQFSTLSLNRCSNCDNMYLLSIKNTTLKTNKEGKVEEDHDKVVQNMLIDGESNELIKAVLPSTGGSVAEG